VTFNSRGKSRLVGPRPRKRVKRHPTLKGSHSIPQVPFVVINPIFVQKL
jgi:hypothetical protein